MNSVYKKAHNDDKYLDYKYKFNLNIKNCTWYIQMDITVLTFETICVQWPSSSFYYLDVILG